MMKFIYLSIYFSFSICTTNTQVKTNQGIGTVKFIGRLLSSNKKSTAIFFGIILRQPKGSSNGSIDNRQYFTCDSKYGMFVKRTKISKIFENKKNKKRITILDTIYIESRKCSGIVQFIGEVSFAKNIFYGIELQTNDGKNDGSINSITYFNCKENYGLFIKKKFIILYENNSSSISIKKKSKKAKKSKAKSETLEMKKKTKEIKSQETEILKKKKKDKKNVSSINGKKNNKSYRMSFIFFIIFLM